MDKIQFQELSKKLDKIIAILSIQGVTDDHKKIEILKKIGLSSREVEDLLGITNIRRMKGWNKK